VTAPPAVAHRFLVCRADQAPVPWTPPEPTEETGQDVAYFGRALAEAVRSLPDSSALTFVLTWDLRTLPETGRHVVAIVQGDEDGRIPGWANDVRVTFKCYGARPPWMPVLPRPGVLEALELAHFGRRALRWVPGAVSRAWGSGRPWRRRPPIHPVPLGYYNQHARPPVPFRERRWSISFAGSGIGPPSEPGWRNRLATPKQRARAQMQQALDELSRARPHEPIASIPLPHFPDLQPGVDRHARQLTVSYSDLLAQTRICLVPRGNSPETFRFFEALRAGCVVVCEPLPDHWFYRRAPTVRVRRWADLGTVLAELLDDRAALEQLHRASIAWWESRCSEEALGRYMAERIRG
jgi:Exostosin family